MELECECARRCGGRGIADGVLNFGDEQRIEGACANDSTPTSAPFSSFLYASLLHLTSESCEAPQHGVKQEKQPHWLPPGHLDGRSSGTVALSSCAFAPSDTVFSR